MTKPYRVEGRLKNNRLWEALRRTFPNARTQTEMAARIGVDQNKLCAYLTMREHPALSSSRQASGRRWEKAARIIAEAIGETPEYLYDDRLYGRGGHRFSLDFTPAQLGEVGLVALPPAPDEALDERERGDAIKSALESLTPREAEIVTLRFGLDGGGERLLDEVAAEESPRRPYRASRDRIREIEMKALRKLRHPLRAKYLREFR